MNKKPLQDEYKKKMEIQQLMDDLFVGFQREYAAAFEAGLRDGKLQATQGHSVAKGTESSLQSKAQSSQQITNQGSSPTMSVTQTNSTVDSISSCINTGTVAQVTQLNVISSHCESDIPVLVEKPCQCEECLKRDFNDKAAESM